MRDLAMILIGAVLGVVVTALALAGDPPATTHEEHNRREREGDRAG